MSNSTAPLPELLLSRHCSAILLLRDAFTNEAPALMSFSLLPRSTFFLFFPPSLSHLLGSVSPVRPSCECLTFDTHRFNNRQTFIRTAETAAALSASRRGGGLHGGRCVAADARVHVCE